MDKKLFHAIKSAKESLKGLDLDDIEKQVAFSKAVDYFLGSKTAESPTSQTKSSRNAKSSAVQKPPEEVDFWSNFETASGIKLAKLKDVYSIKNNQINLVLPKIKGSNKPEQQSNLALLVLYAYAKGLGTEWLPAHMLTESAKDSGVYDTEFSRNLEKFDNLFRKSGSRRGLKYKLSAPGMNEAKIYLSSI